MEGSSQSISFYKRLINSVLGIIGCTDPRPRASREVLIEENFSNNSIGKINKSSIYEGSEIMIEFRHRNASENTVHVPEKNGHEKKIDDHVASKNDQGNGKQGSHTLDHREKDVNIQGSEDSEEERRLKAKRQLRPFQRVVSDIDKRSDAYIERMKKAMNRNDSFDH